MGREDPFYAAWSPDGLVDFDDPGIQHTRFGFATDGKVFYFTVGSPESDIWVADLTHP